MDDEGGGWTLDIEWKQVHGGAQNKGVGGGGMCARPLEWCLVMSNGDGVGKTNQRGWKNCWNVERMWVGETNQRGGRMRG